MDTLIQTVERMVDRLSIIDRPELQIRNPNFRGQQQPQFQIKQRGKKALEQPAQQQQPTTVVVTQHQHQQIQQQQPQQQQHYKKHHFQKKQG